MMLSSTAILLSSPSVKRYISVHCMIGASCSVPRFSTVRMRRSSSSESTTANKKRYTVQIRTAQHVPPRHGNMATDKTLSDVPPLPLSVGIGAGIELWGPEGKNICPAVFFCVPLIQLTGLLFVAPSLQLGLDCTVKSLNHHAVEIRSLLPADVPFRRKCWGAAITIFQRLERVCGAQVLATLSLHVARDAAVFLAPGCSRWYSRPGFANSPGSRK